MSEVVGGRIRGRTGRINQTVIAQADFFQGDGFTRCIGITPGDLMSNLFFNNVPQPWSLVNGAIFSDAQVKSGQVCFHEIMGSAGYYSLRFRPNASGYWRLLLTFAAGQQTLAQDYDVMAEAQIQGGLTASFSK